MVIKRIIWAALCSLVLSCLMCGCGSETEELLLIGEAESEADASAAEAVSVSAGETETHAPERQAAEVEICVYVCGAVNRPGVVSLREGSRAADALEAAGGFGEDASTDYVNLAAKVSDGEKLYFPRVDECERGLLQDESRKSAGESGDSGLININTADTAMLCTLPGIGEARAAEIIRYRETSGPFESCEDIMKVSGIKTSVYNRISDLITVN